MTKNLIEKARQNWFQILVIILLVLCYVRLGKIKENAFYTADMVDASASRVINSLEDISSQVDDIHSSTENIYYEVLQ